MLNRYLGNKTTLLDFILAEIDRCSPLANRPRVGDYFSGTLAVSLALKEAGCDVVSNDVQTFSGVIGEAFLTNNEIPMVPSSLVPAQDHRAQLEALTGQPGFHFLKKPRHADRYSRILDILSHLEKVTDSCLPSEARHSYFYDTYTEEGIRSTFTSNRGTSGRRRFFSPNNGRHIDASVNQIRHWWRTRAIDRTLYKMLCSSLMRAVEKVSNTQGTYHDFPRNEYDSRALKPMFYTPPPMDVVLCGGDHIVGFGDSLEFARTAPALDVLYLDPPYNFRQYTAYYFIPNLLCRYGDMEDHELEDWFNGVEYVRGQNMVDNFNSTFCSKRRFLDDLGTLIDRARPTWVVLSYFDGRNHWNDFKKEPNGIGSGFLMDFFSSDRFEPGSRMRPIDRSNYQSYGGYTARSVKELLFVAKVMPAHLHDKANKRSSSGAALNASKGP